MSELESNRIGRYPSTYSGAIIHLVGTVITGWGRVESCLADDVFNMWQSPRASRLVEGKQFPHKASDLIRYWTRLRGQILSPDKEEKTNSLAERLRHASSERNCIAHYTWPLKADDPMRITLLSLGPPRGRGRGKPRAIQQKTKTVDVDGLNDLNEELFALLEEVSDEGESTLRFLKNDTSSDERDGSTSLGLG